jgi:hypothetical protein
MQEQNIDVYEVSADRNYWIVRAGKNSTYYNHFIKNQIVAIGHADKISFLGITDDKLSNDKLSNDNKNKIIERHKTSLTTNNSSRSQISTQNGQVRRFLHDIKINDFVITVNDTHIVIGKVLSECYYSRHPLHINALDGKEHAKCEFSLRYNVEWGRAYFRNSIPYTVEKSLRNISTLFRISDKEQIKTLNHWLYPIHFSDGEIRCSINITAQDNLPNRDITNLSQVFDQLELLAKYLEVMTYKGTASFLDFERYVDDYLKGDGKTSLTAQHAFMSPGHQFLQLPGSLTQQLYFGMAFAAMFHSSMSFASVGIDKESLIDEAFIIDLVNNITEKSKVERSKENLKAKLPSQNKILEKDITPVKKETFTKPKPSNDTML